MIASFDFLSSMQWISWSYAVPAMVFLVVAFVWYAVAYSGGRIARVVAVSPVLCCYLMAGVLLLSGGCHRIAHVKLEGVEADLEDWAGKARSIVIGGKGGEHDPAIYVPGYPVDALRLERHGKQLVLKPGFGYRRDLLVRSGGKLISLENSGTPKLVPLEDGDRIHVGASSGGGEQVEWILGNGKYDLTPKAGVRWLGGNAEGILRAPGYPAKVLGFRKVRQGVQIYRGEGWTESMRVLIDGRKRDLAKPVAYRPGETRLTLMREDPLVGVVTWKTSGFMGSKAELVFEGSEKASKSVSMIIRRGQGITIGGSAHDGLFVRGMPKSAMRLYLEGDLLVLKETSGEKIRRVGSREGWQLQVGEKDAPSGGLLVLKDVVREAIQPEDGPVPDVQPTGKLKHMICEWHPNQSTRWVLPNRKVTVPMVGYEVPVFVRHKWKLKVYPLANLTGLESGVKSCVVYGADELEPNQAGLLVMDPGVSVERAGKTLEADAKPMVIALGKGLEFMKLESIEESGVASSVRRPGQPGKVVEIKKVRTRRKTGEISLKVREDERGKKVPYVEMKYTEPVIRDIPIEDLEDDVEENEALEGRIAFGVNEQSEFASLPHQVRFRSLTNWFRKATGEVELRSGELRVQDDYGRSKLDYGQAFTVGGEDRLMMRVDKMMIPWGAIMWMALAGGLAFVFCWHWCRSFAGMALFFGVAYLTCSRVLFGQAVLVNAPYDPSTITSALRVMVALPVILSLLLWISGRCSGGRILALRKWVASRPYWLLAAVAGGLLLLRIGLLFLGVKEGLDAGGSRVALSIFFVPAWLLLFAAGMAKVLERRGSGKKGQGQVGGLWKNLCYSGWLFVCQGLSGLAVSDVGVFVYLIPQSLVLAVMGGWCLLDDWRSKRWARAWKFKDWKLLAGRSFCEVCLLLPLFVILMFCFKPQVMMGNISKFNDPLMNREEIPTDSTALRVLQFLDKDYLINLGTDAAESIAQDHAIMENYAHRGMMGQGYLQVEVIPAKYVTAMNDNVSAVYIFGQFGVLGACAVLMAYVAVALSGLGSGSKMADWAGAMAALSFALTSLYMLAANWGLTPFTGRNMYLLGLNSLGDVVESAVLLGIVVVARGFCRSESSKPNRRKSIG